MRGILLLVTLVIFTSDTYGTHCPMATRKASVVDFCSGDEVTNSKVYIDGAGAVQLRNTEQTSCSCTVSLQNASASAVNRISVTSPADTTACESRIEIQAKLGGMVTYTCDFKQPYISNDLELNVTFRKLSRKFLTGYCLIITPDYLNLQSSAKVTVKCPSQDKTSSTTIKTTSKESNNQISVTPTVESSPVRTSTNSLKTTSSQMKTADHEYKDEVNIVPVALGAGVGGGLVIVIVTAVSIIVCRRNKGKISTSTKSNDANDDIEMTENALYNLPGGDAKIQSNAKSSTLEIRHIEVAGGDVYALPSKSNSASQSQFRGTLQEEFMYSTPPETVYDGKNTEQEHNDQINQALVEDDGENRETVKSYYYAEPEDGIETPQTSVAMDPTYAEVC